MIRVTIFGNNAYGYDVTGWENNASHDLYYGSLLEEDLMDRVNGGDIVMYFNSDESAKEWCEEHNFKYEFVEDDNN